MLSSESQSGDAEVCVNDGEATKKVRHAAMVVFDDALERVCERRLGIVHEHNGVNLAFPCLRRLGQLV